MRPLNRTEEAHLADALLERTASEIAAMLSAALTKLRRAYEMLDELGIDNDHPLALLLAGALQDLESLEELLP
ncbi:MAG: hypothetical protein PVJ34_10750 [Anaerolineae bacterium]|jgi:hypothetical protein